jgi:hypothetical protein
VNQAQSKLAEDENNRIQANHFSRAALAMNELHIFTATIIARYCAGLIGASDVIAPW